MSRDTWSLVMFNAILVITFVALVIAAIKGHR